MAAVMTVAEVALATFLRLNLGLVFLAAGLSKLLGPEIRAALWARPATAGTNPRAKATEMRWTKVAPWLGLGAAEAIVGALALAGYRSVAAAAMMLVLLLLFTAYLVHALRSGRRRRCRCGGLLGDQLVNQALILRNAVLLGASALLLGLEANLATDLSLDCALAGCLPWQQPRPPVEPAEARASLAGSVAGLALTAASLHLYLRHRPRDEAEPEPASHPL